MAEECPGVPIHVETISNSQRPIPFLESDFWKGFPDLHAADMLGFMKLIKQGHALKIANPPEGSNKKSFDIERKVYLF